MSKRLTIRDIANMAEVSPTVVSFVINGKDGVNRHTRERVLEVIKKTGFTPNISSRRLTMKKSFNIGIAFTPEVSPFSNLFFFEVAQGVLDKSKDYGYNIVFTGMEKVNNKYHLPDIVEKGDTDGIVFLMTVDKAVLDALAERNIPAVLVDYHGPTLSVPCVKVNYERAAYVATRHLIEQGHRDIAFLSQNGVPNFYNQVFTGFRKALEASDIMIPLHWICSANDEAQTISALNSIIAGKKPPTAIFCSIDNLAIEAMAYLKTKGFRVPEDISFIGIDDIIMSQYMDPPLSSVRIDKWEMGVQAMELIMRIMEGEKPDDVTICSDNLILRRSVTAPPTQNR
ncbi:MAG: LacI family DNA-binding transcriptional regulator [Oscillospiraceae bacterium]|nr:LacI family DNA-binding transcriptional regulator [Oscillospiraceae bacterium]